MKRPVRRKYSLTVILCALFAAECMLAQHSLALIGINEGEKPKEIVLKSLHGDTVMVSRHFGKRPLILLFWELSLSDSFLDYSLDELKFLNEFYVKHHEKDGLEIFAVYTPVDDREIPDAELREVRNLISSNKIEIPVLIDEGFKAFRDYGVIALPSTILVARTGTIERIHASFPLAARKTIAQHVRMLIGAAAVVQKVQGAGKKERDSRSLELYRYAVQMHKKNLTEQAFSALNKFLAEDQNYSWAHNLKGIILWKQGNFTDSAKAFKQAIALDNNIAARINYAILLSDQGNYRESKDVIKAASYERVDLQVRAHYLLGLAYKNMNRLDMAIGELEMAESFFEVWASQSEDSHFYTFSYRIPILRDLSALYSESGDVNKAMERLQKAVNIALGHEGGPGASRRGYMVYE